MQRHFYQIKVHDANTRDLPVRFYFETAERAKEATREFERQGYDVETYPPIAFCASTASAVAYANAFFGRI